MKVLIYSSKELFDNSSFEGRAEADLIAYYVGRRRYEVTKVKYPSSFIYSTGNFRYFAIKNHIRHVEDIEIQKELEKYRLTA